MFMENMESVLSPVIFDQKNISACSTNFLVKNNRPPQRIPTDHSVSHCGPLGAGDVCCTTDPELFCCNQSPSLSVYVFCAEQLG